MTAGSLDQVDAASRHQTLLRRDHNGLELRAQSEVEFERRPPPK